MPFRLLSAMMVTVLVAACESPDKNPSGEKALAINQTISQIADQLDLWPGFDPMTVPLAIYTGKATWLFRHPSPPEDFAELIVNGERVFRREGRHPLVTSNTVRKLADSYTATLLAHGEFGQASPAALAATALHESFHVHQYTHHPDWVANETVLFIYPDDDPQLLALRRLESIALERAVHGDEKEVACWTARALEQREMRFADMAAEFMNYERELERLEGLGYYIEYKALGKDQPRISDEALAADEVRLRSARAGAVLAFILDRLQPGWRESLATKDDQYLDQLLTPAVKDADLSVCRFNDAEISAQQKVSRVDVEALAQARLSQFRTFEELAGWRVTILASNEALLLRRFDPMNVERLKQGLLHVHKLALGNDRGRLDMQAEARGELQALTVSAGDHPLFEGVRELTVGGLSEPVIQQEDGGVSLETPGFTMKFKPARVKVDKARSQVTVALD